MYNMSLSNAQQQAIPFSEVSIRTVELVAAAKIYLETRYSELFMDKSKSNWSTSDSFRKHAQRHKARNDSQMSAQRPYNYHPGSENLRLFRALKKHRYTRATKNNEAGDYEVLRLLGKGSFGMVQLVRKKIDIPPVEGEVPTPFIQNYAQSCYPLLHNKVYAMKVIRKSDMLKKGQEGHLRAERDFFVASERSHWVVPLIECFQDMNHLYLVMEYMIGGDFLALLLRYKVLSEEMTRFYIAEMILCVEEVHKMKWIHRDVKPDNFLISSSGHLKISDFGLAFDGHWCHNQKYFIQTRHSIVKTLGIEIVGDVQDIGDATVTKKKEFEYSFDSKQTCSRSTVDTMRPGGHFLLDYLDIAWKRKLAKTVVGTSQYMAPEVIKGEEYDGRCD
jgi:protein-serine/threonine kinase